MASLSPHGVLSAWERGLHAHPVDRALVMLAAAFPGAATDDLASLSVGERDARLLAVREETFGPRLESLAQCPACGERLEFALSTTDLKVDLPDPPPLLEVHLGEERLAFRLPNSYDLAAVAHCADPNEARLLLARRCLLDADLSQLPSGAIEDLSSKVAACDPQSDILLDLACPSCGHAWQVVFDIGPFLWEEVSGEALRLVQEVHTLARVYGWSEADILSMSPARRRLYVDLVS
jgi:hypothetical protein